MYCVISGLCLLGTCTNIFAKLIYAVGQICEFFCVHLGGGKGAYVCGILYFLYQSWCFWETKRLILIHSTVRKKKSQYSFPHLFSPGKCQWISWQLSSSNSGSLVVGIDHSTSSYETVIWGMQDRNPVFCFPQIFVLLFVCFLFGIFVINSMLCCGKF